MGIAHEHELHQRRRGRNIGVGLVLAAFIAIVFGMTIVKIGSGDYASTPELQSSEAANGN
ncbi:hypothetical protein AYJ57_14650 [Salipiger sp. CCB-MM3]|uniref:hypothetical protein n=1 Tax=Roseobacteraceae TaxID=2854170 RepID=UPI00080AACC1|nr:MULTISPECIES: hypothetical protein [Roseobacteraceae]ANT61723.1 hypothetical protein AYJ57_14650 [Salipiger sp. CCB-MM3]MCA0996272.1 hypothetical protein [Alloyangia pacifica]